MNFQTCQISLLNKTSLTLIIPEHLTLQKICYFFDIFMIVSEYGSHMSPISNFASFNIFIEKILLGECLQKIQIWIVHFDHAAEMIWLIFVALLCYKVQYIGDMFEVSKSLLWFRFRNVLGFFWLFALWCFAPSLILFMDRILRSYLLLKLKPVHF